MWSHTPFAWEGAWLPFFPVASGCAHLSCCSFLSPNMRAAGHFPSPFQAAHPALFSEYVIGNEEGMYENFHVWGMYENGKYENSHEGNVWKGNVWKFTCGECMKTFSCGERMKTFLCGECMKRKCMKVHVRGMHEKGMYENLRAFKYKFN